MKNVIRARKAVSSVLSILLIFIIIIAAGIMLFNFVMGKVEFMKNTFNSQMTSLLLKSFTINSTHITVWLENIGNSLVRITSAYVNGLIATLTNNVLIKPGLTTAVFIQGMFMKGNTYDVRLLSTFNVVITFQIVY